MIYVDGLNRVCVDEMEEFKFYDEYESSRVLMHLAIRYPTVTVKQLKAVFEMFCITLPYMDDNKLMKNTFIVKEEFRKDFMDLMESSIVAMKLSH